DLGAFLAKAFDPLSGAVLLLGLTHEESIYVPAGHGNRDGQWIRAHGEPTDSIGLPTAGVYFIQQCLASELGSASVQSRRAAIDVVVAGAARGELEFTQAKRFRRQQTQKFLTG